MWQELLSFSKIKHLMIYFNSLFRLCINFEYNFISAFSLLYMAWGMLKYYEILCKACEINENLR